MQDEFNIVLKEAIRLAKNSKFMAGEEEFNRTSETAINILKRIYQKNPQASREDVKRRMDQIMDTLLIEMMDIPDLKSNMLRRNAIKALITDPQLLEEEYKLIISEEKKNGKKIKSEDVILFNVSPRQAQIQILKNVITNVRKYIEEVDPALLKSIQYNVGNKESTKRIKARIGKTKEEREQLNIITGIVGAKNELDRVKYYLTKLLSIDSVEQEVKDGYIYGLITVARGLNRYGVLEKYVGQQNREKQKMKIDEFPEIDEKDAIKMLFDKNMLEKLSIPKLSALYAFWTNRLVKETLEIYKSYIIMYELGLDSKEIIENGDLASRVSKQQIESLGIKFSFIHIKADEIYNECRKKTKHKARISIEPQLQELVAKFGEKYQKYFSGIGGLDQMNNDLDEDFSLYVGLENAQNNLYKQKDNAIYSLISLLCNENVATNWGIIEEPKKTNYIFLGVDLPGLNMPLRLHVKKEEFVNFIQRNHGNSIVQLYDGKDDFVLGGRYVATHFLTQLTDKQQSEILKLASNTRETDYRAKIINHLAFLADSLRYPKHLQRKKISTKKGKTKVKYDIVKKYIDLKTGKKYTKNKDNELTPLDEER